MSDENIILVVEDNDFVRMQIVNYLKEAAYQTLEASEGTTALEQMTAGGKIDLVINDGGR